MMPKIGVLQLQDIQSDMATSLRVIQNYMALADNMGLDIVCFPECFLQGYTLDKQETEQRAISLASDNFQKILKELEDYKATIILGLIEQEGESFYNTAAVIQKGKLLGLYRKVHLFEANFKPGREYPVYEINGFKFGINICYDARFKDGAEALAKQGARAIFYLLNNRLLNKKAVEYRDKHLPNLVNRARESGCWLVSSDVVMQDNTHTSFGCTAVVNLQGEVVDRVEELRQGMVTAILD